MGVDLAPALRGEQPPPSLAAFSHTVVAPASVLHIIKDAALWLRFHKSIDNGEMWVSMQDRDRQFKYRNLDGESWGYQRFDLASDPHGTRDLFDPDDPADRDAAERLQQYRSALIAGWQHARAGHDAALDPEALRALRELGYIQ